MLPWGHYLIVHPHSVLISQCFKDDSVVEGLVVRKALLKLGLPNVLVVFGVFGFGLAGVEGFGVGVHLEKQVH